jgi:rfaE bifunctional protein kinase chain/domain
MVSVTQARLDAIFKGFEGKKIAVIGDLMLDRYIWGSVSRISPEAPVPVVEVDEESTRLGGAANVANNIASLGGVPLMVGVVGDDPGGAALRRLVEERGYPVTGVVTDSSRPTTTKTRVIAHGQHVVRIDHEAKHDIAAEVQERLIAVLTRDMPTLDGIILEDYNKGVMTAGLIRTAIDLARRHKKIITVDPKFNNFFEYTGVTVFKPNRKETEEAIGRKIKDVAEVEAAGRELLKRLQAKNVLLTLGEKGMMLIEENGQASHVPTTARRVADVSGAGDTVISTLTMALAAGATTREASMLANHAGGIVCGEVGIVPIDRKVLYGTALESSEAAGGR